MWSFAMYGHLQQAIVLGYSDLIRLPFTTVQASLYCAAEPQHPEHLLSGEWQGVALADLMAEAQLHSDVNSAIIYSADGSQLALPAEWLEGALLATKLNGETLNSEQGFPVRLIVPGLVACNMPRWVERIEWVDEISNSPMLAESVALITFPKPDTVQRQSVRVQGLAIATHRTVSAIEISIDDGDWFAIPMQLEPNQIAHWALDWTPPGTGNYNFRVRPSLSFNAQQVVITVS